MNKLLPTAIVFPGQGSQSLGMLSDLAEIYPQIKAQFDLATSVLGYDLWSLVTNGPADKLDQTEYTQPILLTASYALYCILMAQQMVQPCVFAGHSLGEYTALVCAQACSFEIALQLVSARGRLMQAAVSENSGAMAAIVGLADDKIEGICAKIASRSGQIITPANYNSPGQTVIAGERSAVVAACAEAKLSGAKLAKELTVSVPSHCDLMRPAAVQLAHLLEKTEFHTPIIPVINNVDVLPYTSSASIREGLKRQLYSPVRWVETVNTLNQMPIEQCLECGPGKVLTNLHKRIDSSMPMAALSDLQTLKQFLSLKDG